MRTTMAAAVMIGALAAAPATYRYDVDTDAVIHGQPLGRCHFLRGTFSLCQFHPQFGLRETMTISAVDPGAGTVSQPAEWARLGGDFALVGAGLRRARRVMSG